MKTVELRKLSDDDLKKELNELMKEQFKINLQRGSEFKKTHLIPNVRHSIARIKTILSERRNANDS